MNKPSQGEIPRPVKYAFQLMLVYFKHESQHIVQKHFFVL